VGEIMPTVTLNRAVFDALVGKKLPTEELKEKIAMIGTDLEKIDDKEIIVEIFPNRPDMLSEQGFARAMRAFLGIKTGLQEYTVKKSSCKVIIDASVTMRPYTACAIVKNISFTDEKIREIMQAQEKLATTHGRNRKKSAYGIYPLENIQFPITYIAKDPEKVKFKPLSFDTFLTASEVLTMHPKAKEYAHLTKEWKKYPFFIDAKDNVMSMLPFTNSQDTGKVETTTKEVFIECSGTDFNNVSTALNMLVTMLADMGGEIYSIEMQYGNKKITTPCLEPKVMDIDVLYANKVLGLELKPLEAKKCLEKMGYGVKQNKALVPAYRADILHQRDIVEDIAIGYGYNEIQEIIPCISTIAQEDPLEIFKTKINSVLVGLGMMEISNFHLIDKHVQTTALQEPADVLEIMDPVSMDYNSLRRLLLPSLLQTLRINKQYEYPQKLFETGVVFKKNSEKTTGAEESTHLGIVISHQKANFTEAKQVAEYIMRMFEIECTVQELTKPYYLEGRAGNIICNNVNVGTIGEIHPQTIKSFGLEMPVAAIELDITAVWNNIEKKL
jgi:phenylalanyl-tRNA synthetase beta chain